MIVHIGHHIWTELLRDIPEVPRLWIILVLLVGSWLIVALIVFVTYRLAF